MALSDALVAFVKEGLQRGLPRAEIADALVRAGWPSDQVARALGSFADVEFPLPVPRPVTNVSARETFLYIVLFATLMISAFNLGDLLFELIDYAVPDASRSRRVPTLQSIRWSLSSLIVAYPVFLWMAWIIDRAVTADPTKRASKPRRYVSYLTLAIAALTLLGDVITVVYSFLGGELTLRFALKLFVVAAIAGAALLYYLLDLRADEAEPET
jgi:hypothetical protein